MYNSFTQSDLRTYFEQLKLGQTHKIPLQPHPIFIAYLLYHLSDIGPIS